MLDFMFLYDKFYEPLPPTLEEYKTKLNALFPHIYDTKHLINTRMQLKPILSSTRGLSEAYKTVTQPDFKFK